MNQILRKENVKEWKPRARHHAKRLLPLAEVLHDIFNNATRAMLLKSRARIYTSKGTYLIRPWRIRGRGYVGIEVKRFGVGGGIKLMVVR